MDIEIEPNPEGNEGVHVHVEVPKHILSTVRSLLEAADIGKQIVQELREHWGGKNNV